MTKLLTSVRNLSEAQQVVAGGSDWLDLKEPRNGALGAVPADTLREVIAWSNVNAPAMPVSATIGDEWTTAALIAQKVGSVAASGVDFVKIGVYADSLSKNMESALKQVLGYHQNLIVICFVDRPLNLNIVGEIIEYGAAGMMLDTAEKASGSLTKQLSLPQIKAFVNLVRGANVLCGLAGKLDAHDIPILGRLAPDYLGFRSAICKQAVRNADVCANRVGELKRTLTNVSLRDDNEQDTELMME